MGVDGRRGGRGKREDESEEGDRVVENRKLPRGGESKKEAAFHDVDTRPNQGRGDAIYIYQKHRLARPNHNQSRNAC